MLFLLLGLFSSQHIIVLTVELVLRFQPKAVVPRFLPEGLYIYFVEIWELPLSREIKNNVYYYKLLVLFELFFTQIDTDFHWFIFSNRQAIMHYELCIMNYCRPQIDTDFHWFLFNDNRNNYNNSSVKDRFRSVSSVTSVWTFIHDTVQVVLRFPAEGCSSKISARRAIYTSQKSESYRYRGKSKTTFIITCC